MYRDDTTDTAWETLPRSTKGYFVISRFGGKGSPTATPASALHQPIAADKVEVWPVLIVARAAANLTNNTAQTFTVQAAVYQTPNESAVVS